MSSTAREFLAKPQARRWGAFFAKAYGLLAALFVFSLAAPVLPPVVLALVWAVLSIAAGIALEYHVVVRKTHRQLMLKEGGRLAALNSGRIISLAFAFVMSAACIAGLVLGAPRWSMFEWCLMAMAPLLFVVAYALVNKFIGKEYGAPFRKSKTVIWSWVILGIILVAASVVSLLVQPPADEENVRITIDAAKGLFYDSPSSLMYVIGLYLSYVSGITELGVSIAAQFFGPGRILWQVALYATAFFGIAELIGLCALERSEVRKVFLPLGDSSEAAGKPVYVKRYVAAACILPLCLAALFLVADFETCKVVEMQGRSVIEQTVAETMALPVNGLNDVKFYSYEKSEALKTDVKRRLDKLMESDGAHLADLINESYDARLKNVDNYLDWYYSLPADYERLLQMFGDNIEGYLGEQFDEKIRAGIDDSELESALMAYSLEVAQIDKDYQDSLSKIEIKGIPRSLMNIVGSAELDEETQGYLKEWDSSRERISASAAVGLLTAGVAANVLAKPFFKKMATKIITALGTRGVGSAAGGAIGSIVGPLGTATGLLIGTAVGIGADYGLLKIDELQNRESYREQIVKALEDERAAWLALVQGELGVG